MQDAGGLRWLPPALAGICGKTTDKTCSTHSDGATARRSRRPARLPSAEVACARHRIGPEAGWRVRRSRRGTGRHRHPLRTSGRRTGRYAPRRLRRSAARRCERSVRRRCCPNAQGSTCGQPPRFLLPTPERSGASAARHASRSSRGRREAPQRSANSNQQGGERAHRTSTSGRPRWIPSHALYGVIVRAEHGRP